MADYWTDFYKAVGIQPQGGLTTRSVNTVPVDSRGNPVTSRKPTLAELQAIRNPMTDGYQRTREVWSNEPYSTFAQHNVGDYRLRSEPAVAAIERAAPSIPDMRGMPYNPRSRDSLALAMMGRNFSPPVGPYMGGAQLADPSADPWAGMRGPGERAPVGAPQAAPQAQQRQGGLLSLLSLLGGPGVLQNILAGNQRTTPMTPAIEAALQNPVAAQAQAQGRSTYVNNGGQLMPTKTVSGKKRHTYGDSTFSNSASGGSLIG